MSYTPQQIEEIKEAFKKMDITAGYSLENDKDMTQDEAELQLRINKIFTPYWFKNLIQLGITRNMKNYSGDYPINLLMNIDSRFIADQINEIIKKFDLEKSDLGLSERFSEQKIRMEMLSLTS